MIFKLLRVKHYVKNVLLFLPYALSVPSSFDEVPALLLGFLSFSMMASSIYILNDIKDIDADRMHPTKKNRPIPSGDVSIKRAFGIMLILMACSLVIGYFIAMETVYILLLYVVLNIIYSSFGKKLRFLDIVFLCSFYLIRIYFGAFIADVPLTAWFIATLSFVFLSLSCSSDLD